MAKAQLFAEIKERVSELAEIKTVDRFKNQRTHIEAGDELPYLMPAVFVEINDLVYSDYLRGIQRVDATIRIHLEVEKYIETDDALNIADKLNKVLHLFAPSNFQPMTRKNETIDQDYDNIEVLVIEYNVSGVDKTGYIDQDKETVQLTLELTPEIITSNNL